MNIKKILIIIGIICLIIVFGIIYLVKTESQKQLEKQFQQIEAKIDWKINKIETKKEVGNIEISTPKWDKSKIEDIIDNLGNKEGIELKEYENILMFESKDYTGIFDNKNGNFEISLKNEANYINEKVIDEQERIKIISNIAKMFTEGTDNFEIVNRKWVKIVNPRWVSCREDEAKAISYQGWWEVDEIPVVSTKGFPLKIIVGFDGKILKITGRTYLIKNNDKKWKINSIDQIKKIDDDLFEVWEKSVDFGNELVEWNKFLTKTTANEAKLVYVVDEKKQVVPEYLIVGKSTDQEKNIQIVLKIKAIDE